MENVRQQRGSQDIAHLVLGKTGAQLGDHVLGNVITLLDVDFVLRHHPGNMGAAHQSKDCYAGGKKQGTGRKMAGKRRNHAAKRCFPAMSKLGESVYHSLKRPFPT